MNPLAVLAMNQVAYLGVALLKPLQNGSYQNSTSVWKQQSEPKAARMIGPEFLALQILRLCSQTVLGHAAWRRGSEQLGASSPALSQVSHTPLWSSVPFAEEDICIYVCASPFCTL